jgi:hypothetical protein
LACLFGIYFAQYGRLEPLNAQLMMDNPARHHRLEVLESPLKPVQDPSMLWGRGTPLLGQRSALKAVSGHTSSSSLAQPTRLALKMAASARHMLTVASTQRISQWPHLILRMGTKRFSVPHATTFPARYGLTRSYDKSYGRQKAHSSGRRCKMPARNYSSVRRGLMDR